MGNTMERIFRLRYRALLESHGSPSWSDYTVIIGMAAEADLLMDPRLREFTGWSIVDALGDGTAKFFGISARVSREVDHETVKLVREIHG